MFGNTSSETSIKPQVTENEVEAIVRKTYGLKGGTFSELHGYDDLNYHFKPTYSCNPFIKTVAFYGYVLKIMNSSDSEKIELCEAQNALMLFLRERDIPSSVPVKTMKGEYFDKLKFSQSPNYHIVRLLEFQPGEVLKSQWKTHPLLYKLGVFLANLNQVLKDFTHPFYESHSSIWHLSSVPMVKSLTGIVKNLERKQLVEKIIEKFTEEVLTNMDSYEKGMIHGDFNEHNVIVNTREKVIEVSAILDFGDSHYSYYLFEVAVACCYMMLECKEQRMDAVMGAGHLLAGYLSVWPEFQMDFGLLKLCICARLCQSLVLGLVAYRSQPENNYVLDSQKMGWPLLEELWEISDEKITEDWNSVIDFYKAENKCDNNSNKNADNNEKIDGVAQTVPV